MIAPPSNLIPLPGPYVPIPFKPPWLPTPNAMPTPPKETPNGV